MNYGSYWDWGWNLTVWEFGSQTNFQDVNLSDPAFDVVFDDLVALYISSDENFAIDDITLEYVDGV